MLDKAEVVEDNPSLAEEAHEPTRLRDLHFVGDAKDPSLVVTQLSDRKKEWVGPWVGNNSAGDFADFKIVPA